jgi:hypothetical protein
MRQLSTIFAAGTIALAMSTPLMNNRNTNTNQQVAQMGLSDWHKSEERQSNANGNHPEWAQDHSEWSKSHPEEDPQNREADQKRHDRRAHRHHDHDDHEYDHDYHQN